MLSDDAISEAEIVEARRRLPRVFSRPIKERLLSWAGWTAFAGLVLYCLVRFDFSPFRLWDGAHELGLITRLMFPPSAGGNFDLFLWAILETLGMAFLGTLIGGVLAFPLGFLAAKNIVPAWIFHFGIRRVFDDPANDPVEPLDTVEYDEERFGTFNVLLQRKDNRFRDTFVGVGGRSSQDKA